MGQWHCAIDGKKYGPVDEQTLQSWIAEGRLKLTDLIWQEGMEQWQPVSNFPQFSAAVGSVPPTIIPGVQSEGRFVPAPTGGTNGTTKVLEITAAAHQALKGKWGLPIGFCVLLGLLAYAVVGIPQHIVNNYSTVQNTPYAIPSTFDANDTPDTIPSTIDADEDPLYRSERYRGHFTYTNYIGNVISLFVQGAFAFGYVVFFLTFIRGGQPCLGNMFDGFKIYGKTLAAHLLMTLFIVLWALLFIIPGIIASFAYSQTFFIIADNPGIGVGQAITRSKKMMRGHKGRLFGMELWFILLSFLCIFTLFIGLLWLVPYICASRAKFYEDLQPPLNQGEVAGPDAVVVA